MQIDEVATITQPSEKWYALRVKTRSEQVIATVARQKGYLGFVPDYYSRRRWSDRMKLVALPLFPGYVFCQLNTLDWLPLVTIPGVLHFVGVRNIPVAIYENEMAAIQIATQSGLHTEPWPYLEQGRPVRLLGGPLARLESLLVESRNHCRFIVSMSLLKRSVAVEVDKAWIAPRLEGGLGSLSVTNVNPIGGFGR